MPKKTRIFCLVLLLFAFRLTAQPTTNNQLSTSTLKEFFKEVESKLGYSFMYSNTDIDDSKTISTSTISESSNINEILGEVFKNKAINYEVASNNKIVLKKATNQSVNQNQPKQTVKGTVVDNLGVPLIGVVVQIKNATTGTATDLDGNFDLAVSDNKSILAFSMIGYKTKEVVVGSQKVINITLEENLQLLDEIVVVGYGTQIKANLTGAVSQVSGDVLENRPIVSAAQGLQGVVPNLNINLNSGAPGQSSSFNIRGNTSLNGGGPLILVDNVQMDLDLVNPDDIASISVLKDAASAAIYGARAAYGVILVTTKNGKRDQKPQISFSALGYWQSPSKKIETINSMQYLDMMDTAYQNGGGSGHYFNPKIYEYAQKYFNDPTNNSPVFYDSEINPNKYNYVGNTNWWDEIYKSSSFSQQYNAGITGGSKNSTYYASIGHNNVEGLLKEGNDNYKRYNINLNVTSDITKWLSFSGKVMYNHSKETHPAGGTSAANSQAYAGISEYSGYLKNDLSPLMPVRHPDGNFAGQGGYTNPIAIQAQGGNSNVKKNDLWTTGAIKITPLEGLVINADYTFNYYSRGQKTHVRKFLDYTAVPGTENYYPWTSPNSVVMANNEDYYTALNAFAEYSKTFKEDHNFKIMGGYNQEYKHNTHFYAGRKDLIDNDNPALNLATGERLLGGSETHWAVNGLFMRLNYNYKQRYLLELNGRYDGSSKFLKDDRYAFFPSASAAWRVSEESFWNPMKSWWDDLKLRVSYGSLGNQAVDGLNMGNFPYLPTYAIRTSMPYLLDGDTPVGIGPSQLVSPFFTWETVNQINFGVDATLLQNRLTASFDIYRRDTKDMLTGGQALPAVLGANVPKENAADMKTTGFELAISWNQQLANGLRYWAKGILSDYTAEITRFANPTGDIGQNYVGRKIGEIWGYRSDGLFQSNEEVQNSPSQSTLWGGNWSAGDVKYVDLDGNDKINWGDNTLNNPGDKTILGNNTPRYTFGLTTGLEHKGFDFEMFWQGIAKRDYAVGGVHFWGFTSEWDVPLKESLDYWTPENTGAYFPRPNWNNGGNRQTSDRYIQNAAYIRLKNVTLGYTLPKPLTNKWGIGSLRLFVVGENLLTFTDLIKSFDPETLDNLKYPMMRKYSVGFNLKF